MTVKNLISQMSEIDKQEMFNELIKHFGKDYQISTSKLQKNHKGEQQWAFNWIGGGYNTEFANTREEAVLQAQSDTNLRVDLTSLRKVTEEGSRELDRIGNLMTC